MAAAASTPDRVLELPGFEPRPLVDGGEGHPIEVLRDARDLGRQNLPRSDEAAPHGTQTLILEHFRAKQSELAQRAHQTLDGLASRCRDEDAIPEPESLAAHWDVAELKIQRVKLEARDALLTARRHERRSLRQLAWFRRHHRLTREADYPSSLLLQLGILGTLVLGESFANMYFFALGSDFGLLGGLIQALTVSLVNVGLAVLVGIFCLRNLQHVVDWRRALGGLGLGLYVAIAIALNLLVAHYRDLFAIDSETALIQVLPHARTLPFELTPHSLLLFAVGIAAAGLGLYKGYTIDDRYPGYGRVHRHYRAAERAYLEQVASVRPQILETLEQAQVACNEAVEHGRKRISELKLAIFERDATARSFALGLERIQEECHRVLRAFREENAQVRTTPPPSYFESYPSFEGRLMPSPHAAFEDQLAAAHQQLQGLEGAAAEYRNRLVKRVELEAKALEAYLNEVSSQVQNELEGEA